MDEWSGDDGYEGDAPEAEEASDWDDEGPHRDFVPNADAEGAVGPILMRECAMHIAWAFGEARQPGECDEDMDTGRSGDADPLGEYCFMCETDDDPANVYRNRIKMLMRNVTHKTPFYVCKTIADYYRTEIMPYHVVNGVAKEWGPRAVYRHVFEHNLDPETILTQSLRQYNEYDRDMARLARGFGPDGSLAPPDPNFVKLHLRVMQHREKCLQNLLALRRQEAKR